jgi:AraC-like DNA-binding protein
MGVLLTSHQFPDAQKRREGVDFSPIRAGALASVKEHPSDLRILLFAPTPDELLVVYFFALDKHTLAAKLCSGFIQSALERSLALRVGVSLQHTAIEGFPKLYMECCAALAAAHETVPQARLYQYGQLTGSFDLPEISLETFSRLILEACASKQPEQINTALFQLLLNLCRSGRLYNAIDSHMAMISAVRYVLDKLDIRLSGSSESAKTVAIEEQLRIQPQTSLLGCHTFCLKMLYAIYDIFQENLRVSNHIIKEALGYIQQNYNQTLTLSKLSEQLMITPNYLSRLFREKTACSFTDYVALQRVEAAKRMLRSGQLKVYEVAEKVGYSDQQYFSRQFKKLTGVTPTQYSNSFIW